jgi:hypothetical protein
MAGLIAWTMFENKRLNSISIHTLLEQANVSREAQVPWFIGQLIQSSLLTHCSSFLSELQHDKS